MGEQVGFIGLGLMGRPMARKVLKAGYPLTVFSRSPGPVDALVAEGARRAGSPAEAARQSDVVITMVPDSPDVRLVLAGPHGVFEGLRQGSVIVDMSSIAPTVARDLAEQAAARGASMLDAPVSGGETGAINGTLSIMIGGAAQAVARVRPILSTMGTPERIVHIGGPGAGQVCKLCNQIAIGGALATVGEAFALARKAGVDPAKVRQALLGGFAASRVLEVHGERILEGNYVPGFRASLYYKDMANVLEAGKALAVPLPVTAVVQQLLGALVASGRADADYSALATVLLSLAGVSDTPQHA